MCIYFLIIIPSKGKIFLVKSTEIHGLCPERDPLAGIVFEFHTTVVIHADATLGTKDTAIIQFCAMKAVGTGFCDLSSKKHKRRLISHDV